ncbi:hypothetical protein FGG08_007601 [Glutinoglossum americanum]|uniref:Phosphoribosyltransferase domain-containing protein n=1 Tax=Glutinoglossum americanum TaxID=1670608 RepID=A0A9P8KZW5_9PEZI|nr:hypothetical protein FGG08_007601 [Glutinoglossum americanum]
MSASALPSNVHVSTHPCLHAKLSQLRSAATNSRDTNRLIHEIALIVGCEALAGAVGLEASGVEEGRRRREEEEERRGGEEKKRRREEEKKKENPVGLLNWIVDSF